MLGWDVVTQGQGRVGLAADDGRPQLLHLQSGDGVANVPHPLAVHFLPSEPLLGNKLSVFFKET